MLAEIKDHERLAISVQYPDEERILIEVEPPTEERASLILAHSRAVASEAGIYCEAYVTIVGPDDHAVLKKPSI